jgi:hypothetical protein
MLCGTLGAPLSVSWSPILALVVALVALCVGLVYSGQPLLEWEAFRQTQTALTSYWMLQEGWRLDYQTPVLGYPWAIPLEFPIYQTIVAAIVWLGGFDLDATGRVVSFCFLLACAWPAFGVVRRLNLPQDVAWIFCALLWSSPMYLYWGRTFLMDTAAVFFALAAVPYALDLMDRPTWKGGFLFAVFASLGLLQKAPTAAPMLLVLGVVLVISQIRANGLNPFRWRRTWIVIAAMLAPIVIAGAWYYYAAEIRAENYLGGRISLKGTYLGTLKMRRNTELWKIIVWDRAFQKNAAGWLGVLLLSLGVVLADGRKRMLILLGLALFLLPILAFFKSHWILEYYQVASVIFLLAALSLSILVIGERFYALAPVVTVLLVAFNWVGFAKGYSGLVSKQLDATNTRALAVGDVIRRYTPSDSRIVVFGLTSFDGPAIPVTSYSSEIVYYSQRKGMTVEDGKEDKISENLGSYLGGDDPGAIVVCGNDVGRYMRYIRQYDKNETPSIFRVSTCYVWLPNTQSIVLPNGQHQSAETPKP